MCLKPLEKTGASWGAGTKACWCKGGGAMHGLQRGATGTRTDASLAEKCAGKICTVPLGTSCLLFCRKHSACSD